MIRVKLLVLLGLALVAACSSGSVASAADVASLVDAVVIADVAGAADTASGTDAVDAADVANAADTGSAADTQSVADTTAVVDADAALDADGAADATPSPTKSVAVLFVGNSYTFVNDLPGRVKAVLTAQGIETRVESKTVAGAMLGVHAKDTAVAERIANGSFDYVVLQAQSVEPVAYPDWFFEAAEPLGDAITKAGAKILYYATWARAPGDVVYEEAWSGGTPEAMTAGLEAAYVKAATLTGGTVIPVGRAFAMARVTAPDLGLYASDGSHPSVAGTYLAACTFAVVLLGQPPEAVGVPDGLAASDATRLRDVAVKAVAAFQGQ